MSGWPQASAALKARPPVPCGRAGRWRLLAVLLPKLRGPWRRWTAKHPCPGFLIKPLPLKPLPL
eukprot:2113586-Pyramimonas_sp.AAC.1